MLGQSSCSSPSTKELHAWTSDFTFQLQICQPLSKTYLGVIQQIDVDGANFQRVGPRVAHSSPLRVIDENDPADSNQAAAAAGGNHQVHLNLENTH